MPECYGGKENVKVGLPYWGNLPSFPIWLCLSGLPAPCRGFHALMSISAIGMGRSAQQAACQRQS